MECEMKVLYNDSDTEVETFVIVSKVLCYINTYLQSCAPANVKRVVVNEFSEDAILNAKKLLWTSHARCHLPEWKERKNSTTRTSAEINTGDIIEGLQSLDQQEHNVKFMVSDIVDLPKYSPEELNSVAFLRRIEDLEKKFESIESAANHNAIEIGKMSDVIVKQADQLKAAEDTLATHGTLIDGFTSRDQDTPPAVPDVPAGTSDGNCTTATTSLPREQEADEEEVEEEEDEDEGSGDEIEDNNPSPSEAEEESDIDDESSCNDLSTHDDQPPVHRQKSRRVEPTKKSKPTLTIKPSMTRKRVNSTLKAATYASQVRRNPRRPQETTLRPARLPFRETKSSRVDKNGFVTPRQQWRQSQRRRKLKKVFFGNVDRQHNVEDVLEFLNEREVTVNGLFQRSRITAAKKSFVCFMTDMDMKKLIKSHDSKAFEIREYVEADSRRQW